MKKTSLCCLVAMVVAACLVISSAPKPVSAQSSSASDQGSRDDVKESFRQFLDKYQLEMRARNTAYLKTVHPKLPAETHAFFFDVTLNMMRYADENEGVEPKIECQDFNICKVVYPQPNDSWAAQRFIRHAGNWRWLDQ